MDDSEKLGVAVKILLSEAAKSQSVASALEESAGFPVIMEAKNGRKAVDLEWLIALLPKVLPLLITLLSGGGFSPVLIPIIIEIIAKLLGVSQEEARQMLSQA